MSLDAGGPGKGGGGEGRGETGEGVRIGVNELMSQTCTCLRSPRALYLELYLAQWQRPLPVVRGNQDCRGAGRASTGLPRACVAAAAPETVQEHGLVGAEQGPRKRA